MTLSEAAASRTAEPPASGARYSQVELDQLIAAHERFVARQPNGRRLSLIYLQGQEMAFSGRDLRGADFTGSNLQRARLVRANLERASLFSADLCGADVREANLRRADVRGVSLRNARLGGAMLDEADLRDAALTRADAAAGGAAAGRTATSSGTGEILFSVDFSHGSLKRARLANAKLRGANFAGALLQGADLKGAILIGAKFDGAVIDGAQLSGAKLDPDALANCVKAPTPQAIAKVRELQERLAAAERWITTGGREGAAAVLDDEDLRPLDKAMAGRPLTALSARRVCAIGVSFAGAQLQGARFDGADLRDADFMGADLRGASFRDANLRHARFDMADVRPLPMATGGTRSVCLDGANLSADCFERSVRT
jgi:uncharacterized protein YjbI with pentapeptide repeats